MRWLYMIAWLRVFNRPTGSLRPRAMRFLAQSPEKAAADPLILFLANQKEATRAYDHVDQAGICIVFRVNYGLCAPAVAGICLDTAGHELLLHAFSVDRSCSSRPIAHWLPMTAAG